MSWSSGSYRLTMLIIVQRREMTMKRRKSDFPSEYKGRSRFAGWLHSTKAKCDFIILFGSVLLFLIFCVASAPQRYDLQIGTISHQSISASRDVVDVVTTEERKRVAAAAVEPTYHLKEGASDEVLAHLRQVLEELHAVQNYGLKLRTAEDT